MTACTTLFNEASQAVLKKNDFSLVKGAFSTTRGGTLES